MLFCVLFGDLCRKWWVCVLGEWVLKLFFLECFGSFVVFCCGDLYCVVWGEVLMSVVGWRRCFGCCVECLWGRRGGDLVEKCCFGEGDRGKVELCGDYVVCILFWFGYWRNLELRFVFVVIIVGFRFSLWLWE